MAVSANNLIWLDLEMTGLDPDTCRIIEAACIITDSDLNIVDEMPVIAIHQSDETLAAMDDWNTRTHTASGLVERVRASTIGEVEAEQRLIDFINLHVPSKASPLCGNSISQDRRFLFRHMPRFEAQLHYRNLDVSTIKILVQRWAPKLMAGLVKTGSHLALDDVRESIAELRYYRQHFLRPETQE
jgi:oligoribonuclease